MPTAYLHVDLPITCAAIGQGRRGQKADKRTTSEDIGRHGETSTRRRLDRMDRRTSWLVAKMVL
jgi:hypothetical protein